MAIQLIKGVVDPGSIDSSYQVDGLSGNGTSTGVTNLLQFWLGQNGFQTFISNFKTGKA